jgi:hypothetical protein
LHTPSCRLYAKFLQLELQLMLSPLRFKCQDVKPPARYLNLQEIVVSVTIAYLCH